MADKMGMADVPPQSLQSVFARVFADYLAMRRVLHSQCSDRWALYLRDARKGDDIQAKAEQLARELHESLPDCTQAATDKCVEVLGRLTTAKNLEEAP